MLNRHNLLCFAFLIFLNVNAYGQTASITLSEDSAQLGYGFLVGGGDFGRTELKTEFLYNSEKTYLLDASLQVFDEVGSKAKGLVAGLGAKMYGGSIRSEAREGSKPIAVEILVLGVGGELRYSIPQNRRFIFGMDAYYAPQIVSFFQADKFYEVAALVEYEILPKASAYIEYRRFYLDSTDSKTKSGSFEDGFRLGMELKF